MSVNLSIDKIRKFISYMSILTFLVAAYGVVTFITNKDFLFGEIYSKDIIFPQSLHFDMGRILSSLGHPDFLGSYLAILSPLFLFNICSCQTKWKRLIVWILYLTVTLAVLLTFSGGAYLAFIVANSILVVLFKKEKFGSINKSSLVFLLYPSIVLAISFIIMIFLIICNNQNINSTVFNILSPLFLGRVRFQEMWNLKSWIPRIDNLKITWGIMQTNPINGIGIGYISSGNYSPNRDMDNLYLSIVSELGLVGLSSFLFLNFAIFKRLLINYKNLMVRKHKLIVLTLFASMISFLTDSFYWNTFYHPTIRIIFWLVIAMSVNIIERPHSVDTENKL